MHRDRPDEKAAPHGHLEVASSQHDEPVGRERRKRGQAAEEDTPTPSDEALILAEIRDLLKAQQAR